jgi:hypothetical protein
MRIILSNAEAERLLSTLAAGPSGPPELRAKTAVRDGGTIYLVVGGVEFPGVARPEPSMPGRLRVEDMDGRVVFEAD